MLSGLVYSLGADSAIVLPLSYGHPLKTGYHRVHYYRTLSSVSGDSPSTKQTPLTPVTPKNTSGRQNLVILGTGWGSYSLFRNIKKKRHLRDQYNVIVISPRNHFLFTPLLASTTVGTLEFRSIIEPVRNTGFRDEHHFHLSHAVGLDAVGKKVECVSVLDPSRVYHVPYDKLVIGVGAVSNDFNVPGVKEHAFFLKVRGMWLGWRLPCFHAHHSADMEAFRSCEPDNPLP